MTQKNHLNELTKLFDQMDNLRRKQKVIMDTSVQQLAPKQTEDTNNVIEDEEIIKQGDILVGKIEEITSNIQNVEVDIDEIMKQLDVVIQSSTSNELVQSVVQLQQELGDFDDKK